MLRTGQAWLVHLPSNVIWYNCVYRQQKVIAALTKVIDSFNRRRSFKLSVLFSKTQVCRIFLRRFTKKVIPWYCLGNKFILSPLPFVWVIFLIIWNLKAQAAPLRMWESYLETQKSAGTFLMFLCLHSNNVICIFRYFIDWYWFFGYRCCLYSITICSWLLYASSCLPLLLVVNIL